MPIPLTTQEGLGDYSLFSSTHHKPPSSVPAAGVPRERVDPRTLQLIERLFPGHHGLDFLARLLRQAEAKQLSLPDLGLPDVCDVAVITAQSVRVLAQLLGLSYDTTEKYVVLFCQLRLLSKERQRRQIILHFPLCHPQLPDPEVLDQLLELRPGKATPRYRPKVRTFANQVKRRFVLLCERGEASAVGRPQGEVSPSPTFLADDGPRLLLEDIRQVIGEEVDSELGKRLLLKIEGAFHYRCSLKPSLLSSPKGDSEEVKAEDRAFAYMKKSTLQRQKVDSSPAVSDQQSLLSFPKGDSEADARQVTIPQKSPSLRPKGDSLPGQPPQKGRLSRQKGDSEAAESESGFPNVNVITVIDSLNVNVSIVALFCCRALGETPGKRGIYCKLFREVEQDAKAVVAAFLYTIVHRQDGTIQRPPAVFIQRCRDFHRQGIHEEAAVLVEQYGQLSYPQLLEALSAKKREPAQAARPAKGAPPAPEYQTPAGLPPITRRQSIEARVPLRPSGGLSLEEAKRLHAAITGDRRVGLCKTGMVVLTDRTYAV
ncbi:MAG TPA: hypothetical protein VKR06_37210, partial [Ktedonosporobacter sp.]|nr:hypothetical protein [Ktedonosporobacter sp.]